MTERAATMVCFPPAGATAGVYAAWRSLLPAFVEVVAVELPGRGARSREPAIGDLDTLVDRLVPELIPVARTPFVVFGHSVGAVIGFEVARALAKRGRGPAHMFVAAAPSDGFPARGRGLHLLPRESLVPELRAMGTPELVLEDDALLDLLLPVVRADLQIATEYAPAKEATLSCPVTAFAGTRDPDISVEDVAGWERRTTGPFRLVRLDAGHNVLKERSIELIQEVLGATKRGAHVDEQKR